MKFKDAMIIWCSLGVGFWFMGYYMESWFWLAGLLLCFPGFYALFSKMERNTKNRGG